MCFWDGSGCAARTDATPQDRWQGYNRPSQLRPVVKKEEGKEATVADCTTALKTYFGRDLTGMDKNYFCQLNSKKKNQRGEEAGSLQDMPEMAVGKCIGKGGSFGEDYAPCAAKFCEERKLQLQSEEQCKGQRGPPEEITVCWATSIPYASIDVINGLVPANSKTWLEVRDMGDIFD